jgi:hypothetical protein
MMSKQLGICLYFLEEENQPLAGIQKGWVSVCKEYLIYVLSEQKGIDVAFIESSDLVQLAQTGFDRPILIITVLSSLMEQPEKRAEAEQFLTEIQTAGLSLQAVCKVWKEPVATTAEPIVLQSHKTYQLYTLDRQTGLALTPDRQLSYGNISGFLFKLFDLASDIEKAIVVEGEQDITDEKHKSVYLAESGYDLLPVRQSIERELLRHGYIVYPDKPYASILADVSYAILEDLKKCSLSIHLFGKNDSATLLQNGDSVSVLENELAARYFHETRHSHVFKRIIWMPEGLKPASEKQQFFLRDLQKQERLHAGADVITCPVEELKDIIIDKLRPETSDEIFIHPASVSGTTLKRVYLMSDFVHEESIMGIKELLQQSGLEVVLPELLPDQKQMMWHHQQNLMQSDAILFLHTHRHTHWLRSKVNDSLRIKGWNPDKKYACKAVVSSQMRQLPNDPVYADVLLLPSEGEINLDLLIPFLNKLN